MARRLNAIITIKDIDIGVIRLYLHVIGSVGIVGLEERGICLIRFACVAEQQCA